MSFIPEFHLTSLSLSVSVSLSLSLPESHEHCGGGAGSHDTMKTSLQVLRCQLLSEWTKGRGGGASTRGSHARGQNRTIFYILIYEHRL